MADQYVFGIYPDCNFEEEPEELVVLDHDSAFDASKEFNKLGWAFSDSFVSSIRLIQVIEGE